MASIACKDYDWAVLYLIGCTNDPFTKVPLIPNTVLTAQAIVGLKPEERHKNFNGSVANGVIAQYKIYMLCGGEYFIHMDNIVDLLNSFYGYLRTQLFEAIDRESAYTICTSVFPPITKPNLALHALLTPYEVKFLTRSQAPVAYIEPIIFNPRAIMEENVVK